MTSEISCNSGQQMKLFLWKTKDSWDANKGYSNCLYLCFWKTTDSLGKEIADDQSLIDDMISRINAALQEIKDIKMIEG